MKNFTLSAFGDEIDKSLDIQMDTLEKHGIKYIEVRSVGGKGVAELSSSEASEIQKRMEERGFGVSCIGSPIGKIDINDDFSGHLELFRNILETAQIMKTEYIRIFSFYYPKEDDPKKYKEEVISRLGEMTLMANKQSITLLHENEKDIYGDTPERCLDILQGVNNPGLKAIIDPANFVQCNVRPFPEAFKLLKRYIKYMHIKDALIENGNVVPAGHGDGEIEKILFELKKESFKGFLSIEPHLGYFEGLENLENGIDVSAIKIGGKESFSIAVNALRVILDKIG